MALDGNMYPNQGDHLIGDDLKPWSPPAPKANEQQQTEELLKIASSAGVIEDVVKWFTEQADGYASIDAIEVNETVPEGDIKVAILLAKRMRQEFQTKAREFQKYYDEVIRIKEKAGTDQS